MGQNGNVGGSLADVSAIDWSTRTFADALTWAAATHGEREAVVHGDTRLSFAQLAQRANAFARGLIALGVAPGEHVALWMSDGVAWLVARWAVPMIGAVLVPVNTRFRENDVAYVLSQSDSQTLIVQERGGAPGREVRYFDILSQLHEGWAKEKKGAWRSERMPMLRRVIGLGADLPPSMTGFEEVEARGAALLGDGVLERRQANVKPEDVAQILYTSGTTSFPKGAMVRHGALLQNNYHTLARMALRPRDRYLSCVPLFTATGTGYVLSMLMAGAAMVIVDHFDARLFCEWVEREKITVGFFVDTIVQDLKAFADRGRYDLSSLRTGTGAPLSRDAFLFAVHELGVAELIGVFGMSETSNAVARGDCRDPLDKRVSTNGRPVPGTNIRIADIETNITLPAGMLGEICIAGPSLMTGYYKMPEETARVLDADGWFHTGDLGELDAEGYLIYRGRLKEMIKPGGFNVATQEIEIFLKTFPGVREAVVVGVPDARLGEVAYAYIEPQAGATLEPQALQAYCREHIASYKVPRHVEFIDTWPLTGSQKIKKLELKRRATQRLATPANDGARAIDATALHARLRQGITHALFDIRDPREAERGHIAGATSLPRRRIETRIGELVRDRATPITVYDSGDAERDGRAVWAARTLTALGYRDVAWLDGGLEAYAAFASERGMASAIATGSNVPSKHFGEQLLHRHAVPSIDAATLASWKDQGRDLVICDVRTPREHAEAHVPGALGLPSFDLALHAGELARHDAVVVHCAGRTRSIVACRTLHELGVTQAVALENGTMGWQLAGYALESGMTHQADAPSLPSIDAIRARSQALAAEAGVTRIDAAALDAWLSGPRRNGYVFDVRSVDDYVTGHVPQAIAVPGGQLVQRMDDFIALRDAPIILIDDGDARAELTAMWLRRMGARDVAVLDGGMAQWRAFGGTVQVGRTRQPAGWDAAVANTHRIRVEDYAARVARGEAGAVLDVGLSRDFRDGHLPGAQWVSRGWLEQRIHGILPDTTVPVLVACADGTQSTYAAQALRQLGYQRVSVLDGGVRAWRAAGLALETQPLASQEDMLLAPYQQGEQAMRDYLAWEVGLTDG